MKGILTTIAVLAGIFSIVMLCRAYAIQEGASTEPNPAISTENYAEDIQRAQEILPSIPIKGRAPKTGYDRDNFGPAWKDVDHNGCDTRNDILARDLTDVTYKEDTKDCVVSSGTLQDPYTGKTIDFTRGKDTSTAVQIDHVVSLSDAWQKGAQDLSQEDRENLANDPENLIAVDGPTNMSKGDGDAATWIPPYKPYRCEYVAKQTFIKAKYGLWMTSSEWYTIDGMLLACSLRGE